MAAEGVNLLRKQHIIKSILSIVSHLFPRLQFFLRDLAQLFAEHGIIDLTFLYLGVGFVCDVHPHSHFIVEYICDICCLVDMLLEVRLLGKFEHVGVESWHRWLNVIEQIRLLHVTSIYFDLDLLKEIFSRGVLGKQGALNQKVLHCSIVGKTLDSFL